MITEDYVNFEVAKLLKEKGFDGFCNRYYLTDKEDVNGEYAMFMFASDLKSFCTVTNSLLNKHADKNHEIISAPTLQMAMKWLREEKGIAVIPIISSVLDHEKFLWDVKIVVAKTNDSYSQGWVYEKQEDACEAAIKYCLENLI